MSSSEEKVNSENFTKCSTKECDKTGDQLVGCDHCGNQVCEEHSQICDSHSCSLELCEDCLYWCEECGKNYCLHHSKYECVH